MPAGRKPGQTKVGGRKKGVPNKGTLNFLELAEKNGVKPGEMMMRVVKGERIKALMYKDEDGNLVEGEAIPTLDQMIQADKEICQYVYPKRKAVEHSGNVSIHEALLDELDET